MAFLQILISTIGRICLSGIFILGGVQKILSWHDYEEVVTRALCDWHVYGTSVGNVEPYLDTALGYVHPFPDSHNNCNASILAYSW